MHYCSISSLNVPVVYVCVPNLVVSERVHTQFSDSAYNKSRGGTGFGDYTEHGLVSGQNKGVSRALKLNLKRNVKIGKEYLKGIFKLGQAMQCLLSMLVGCCDKCIGRCSEGITNSKKIKHKWIGTE